MVEMDWALVTIEQWPHHLDAHIRRSTKGLYFSKIIPEARVKATGRTSGTQIGLINTAMSIASHGIRFTQEWSLFKDPQASLQDWIEGGIGVDGDSGAWIIDQDTNALYGMAWARDRIETEPICLFSPIEDIVADIKEITGAEVVCLPPLEGMPIVSEEDDQ